MGTTCQSDLDISGHYGGYFSLHGLVPWQTQQITLHQVIVTLWSACATIHSAPLGSTCLWAQQNWHTLPMLGCQDGNVPSRGTSVHHHTHRQMAERRIFALYSEASRAVLAGHCKENADTWLFQTISDIPPHVVSNEDPRQGKHRDNAKTGRNIRGRAYWRVQLPAFSLFNWPIDDVEETINGVGIIFLIAEGVGEGENWINNSVPNPTSPLCTSCTLSLLHGLWRCLALSCFVDWVLITEEKERERVGDWQTKKIT